MKEPIISIVPVTDEFSCHCAIVIVPNFIKYELGILIRVTAGYSFYLVTDLTLFTFPIPEYLLSECGFKIRIHQLDLRVAGSKLIGSDLLSVYSELPFLSLDIDHTDEVPSVIINDKSQAFSWLIKNGVMPVKPFKFHFNLAAQPDPRDFCKTTSELNILLDFIQNSRIVCSGITYNDFVYLMSRVSQLSNCFSLLITENADTPTHQHITITSGSIESGLDENVIQQHRIILIDGDTWLMDDYESIASSQSPIIIFTENPLFDCLSGNINAPLMYGLCPILSIGNKIELLEKMGNANIIASSSIVNAIVGMKGV